MTRRLCDLGSWGAALALSGAATCCLADISVAVSDNTPPLASRNWPEQGLGTAIVRDALALQAPDENMRILWPNGAAGPLEMLDEHRVELALLVPRPGCQVEGNQATCALFHFSDPVIEIVWRIFVHHDREFTYASPADLIGKQFCLADDTEGARWDDAPFGITATIPIDAKRTSRIEECFSLLRDAQVDAVIADEFSGVQALFDQNLTETVVPLPKPLGTQTLHVAASKSHWRATTLLYRVNAGLAELKQSGAYQDLVAHHVERFWERLSLTAR